MTDLIERLRASANDSIEYGSGATAIDLREAADEIERLEEYRVAAATVQKHVVKLEAELKTARGQNRVQSDFLRSRQCSDHSGKWQRGKCLQCELEKARERVATLQFCCEEIYAICAGHAPEPEKGCEKPCERIKEGKKGGL